MNLSRLVQRAGLLLIALALLALAAACGGLGSGPRPVRVGSKDFTEEFIVGNMYALLIEANGIPVERKLNLGGTPVLQQALVSDQVDVYPEYTGTGLLTVLKLPSMTDRQAVYSAVKDGYKKQFNLAWLDPAPMNNTQALAMKKDVAAQRNIKTISDMAAQASELTMIGPPEFEQREDGLPGISKAYGNFQLKKYLPVDPGLRYEGLVNGQADVVVAFGTDGQLAAYDLLVLQDDKGLFPPYQIAPVIRQQALDANPKLAGVLNQLAPLLDDATMRTLNYEVDGKRREPADVAKEFLQQRGLIK